MRSFYIHVHKSKNILKCMTRFKWKWKVLFYQIKGFGRRLVGGMLLKKKIVIFQCCLKGSLAVLATELLPAWIFEGCFPLARKLHVFLNYLSPGDHVLQKVFQTVSSNPFYVHLSVKIKFKLTFSFIIGESAQIL